MDYEKKLRLAKEALETGSYDRETIEYIFPELKESGDERIRKELINYFSDFHLQTFAGLDPKKILVWLEKQKTDKEINLIEILKHYPKETELYSPLYGKLWLAEVDEKNEIITCYKHHLEEGCTRAVLEQEDTVSFYSNGTTGLPDFNVSKQCMLFLYDIEKQDEQKSKNESTDTCDSLTIKSKEIPTSEKRDFGYFSEIADKAEAKFHIGDWIVTSYGKVSQVIAVDEDGDGFTLDDDTYFSGSWKDDYHLWSINDAKDGDVLACDKCILIFDQLSEFNNEQVLMDICHCTSKGFYWQDTKDRDLWVLDGFKPATKEQRDALFAKMHEAGYEWDAEKKELKIIDWSKHIKYEPNSPSIIEENPAWSDEDEETILKMMFTFRTRVFPSSEECISFIDFLKSLKDKFQPRQNWSEEDEKERKRVVGLLEGWMSTFKETYYAEDCKRGIEWLKSIKQRMG